AAIRRLERFDLQFVEQPCRTLEELAEVRARVSAPIAADESVAGAEDVERAAEGEACDVVNVKLAHSGGFGPAREALRRATELGIAPFLSSTLDGPWGIAASLQLAAAERLSLACGLATLELFDAELAAAIPPPESGLLAVPPGPGLGIEPSGRALGEVLVEEVEQHGRELAGPLELRRVSRAGDQPSATVLHALRDPVGRVRVSRVELARH